MYKLFSLMYSLNSIIFSFYTFIIKFNLITSIIYISIYYLNRNTIYFYKELISNNSKYRIIMIRT